ncbi:DUF6411 family protein [Fodinicola acaciae]|uniref:DUF6411 family protein n=1 Tax=Fodinicola acaciae TaxID=2681555 RepID=UPI0013D13A98|nr:DUF6411 family protein [Fodinicola acaciae]
MVVLAIVVGVCVLLLIAGLLAPRLSRRLQRGTDRTLGFGAWISHHAPGKLGRWLARPWQLSRRAADRSAETGREGRRELKDATDTD